MAITFNTNLAALGAQRNIGIASSSASSSLSKLSSGSRVPQAKDDAAGLAIGSKLKSEVAGLTQASNNAAQAVSLLQIADGALSTVGDILQRMKALAVQSSSGQLADADRSLLNQEFSGLKDEVNRIANTANFNGTNLLSGTAGVFADTNDISTGGTAITGKNLIGQGVSNVSFGNNFTAGAVELNYNANGTILTMKNLVTGQSDSVSIGSTAIANGTTQTVNFNGLGATVTLNSTFNKNVSTDNVNGYRIQNTAVIGGAQAAKVTAGTASISAFRLKDSAGISAADLNAIAFTVTGAVGGGVAGAGSTIASATVGGRVFNVKDATTGLGTGTVDLSTTGAKTVTLVDSAGNELDLSFTVATAFANGDVATITPSITGLNTSVMDVNFNDLVITKGGAAVAKVNTITATAMTLATGTTLKASDFNGRTFTFNTTTAATSTAAIASFNDSAGVAHVFHSQNNTTSTLATTGSHAMVLEDDQGNTITIDVNLTTLLANGDVITGAVTLDHAPSIQNNSVKLLGVSKGSTSTFNFGNLDSAAVSWNTATATAAVGTATINGLTFTSNAVDLTTAGLKTVTLTNGSGTAATSLTYQFNVGSVLDADDVFTQVVGEFGAIIGANSQTGGSTTFNFKVGTGTTTNDNISFSLGSATASSLGIDTTSIATAAASNTAITAVNAAINTISSRRADVGASQSRLGFASNSISVAIENTTAAASALLDVDVSAEITKFTNQNVLMQAGISLLGQANQQPALLLRLLQ